MQLISVKSLDEIGDITGWTVSSVDVPDKQVLAAYERDRGGFQILVRRIAGIVVIPFAYLTCGIFITTEDAKELWNPKETIVFVQKADDPAVSSVDHLAQDRLDVLRSTPFSKLTSSQRQASGEKSQFRSVDYMGLKESFNKKPNRNDLENLGALGTLRHYIGSLLEESFPNWTAEGANERLVQELNDFLEMISLPEQAGDLSNLASLYEFKKIEFEKISQTDPIYTQKKQDLDKLETLILQWTKGIANAIKKSYDQAPDKEDWIAPSVYDTITPAQLNLDIRQWSREFGKLSFTTLTTNASYPSSPIAQTQQPQPSEAVTTPIPLPEPQVAPPSLKDRFPFLRESNDLQLQRLKPIKDLRLSGEREHATELTREETEATGGRSRYHTSWMKVEAQNFHAQLLNWNKPDLTRYSKEGILRHYLGVNCANIFAVNLENVRDQNDPLLKIINDPPPLLVEISGYYHVLKAMEETAITYIRNKGANATKEDNLLLAQCSRETDAIQKILFELSQQYMMEIYFFQNQSGGTPRSNPNFSFFGDIKIQNQIKDWRKAWIDYQPGSYDFSK